MKTALAVVAGFLAVILLALALHFTGVYVFGTAKRATADYRGQTEAIERLYADGDYRIAVYNQFFDKCASVQTFEQQIQIQQEELQGNPSKERKLVLQANLTALKGQRASLINQYNADSAKDFTMEAFKDLDLPFRLDMNDMETQCAL